MAEPWRKPLTATRTVPGAMQALSNALRCCAKLGHRDPALVTCLLEVAAVKLGEFNDQNTSMMLHALVSLNWRWAGSTAWITAACRLPVTCVQLPLS
jgi:hypothetical protein